MKSFVVFTAVLACAVASPQFLAHPGYYNGFGLNHFGYAAAPIHYAAPAIVAPAFTKTQYHAQDEFGQSSHGYAHPGQAAAEVRDAFGNVRGSYSYVDPNGKVVQTNYVADAVNGFRVESNALPVGPSVPDTPALIAPSPVQDTPEVAAARAEHARAVEEAKARNAAADASDASDAAENKPESRKKRGLTYTYPIAAAAPLTYSHIAAAPLTTYSHIAAAAPLTTYSHIAAAPLAYHAPLTYAAVPAVRQATLTKVINTPGHAVSYRVD